MPSDTAAWDILPTPFKDASSASPVTSDEDVALNQLDYDDVAGSTTTLTTTKSPLRPMRKRSRPSEPSPINSTIPQPIEAQPPQASDPPAAKRNRIPHSIVERRYRNNINAQIETLATKVPIGRQRCASNNTLDIEELAAYQARGPSKAEVLTSTIAYIEQLEEKSKSADAAMNTMRAQIAGLQKLVQCDDCAILREFQDLTLSHAMAA